MTVLVDLTKTPKHSALADAIQHRNGQCLTPAGYSQNSSEQQTQYANTKPRQNLPPNRAYHKKPASTH